MRGDKVTPVSYLPEAKSTRTIYLGKDVDGGAK